MKTPAKSASSPFASETYPAKGELDKVAEQLPIAVMEIATDAPLDTVVALAVGLQIFPPKFRVTPAADVAAVPVLKEPRCPLAAND